VILLGSTIPNSAAQLVARIAFDPFAQKAAHKIVGDMAAARINSHSHAMVALPPFQGDTQWTLIGERIDSTSWPRFLVHRIVRCTGPLPFRELESERENAGFSLDLRDTPAPRAPSIMHKPLPADPHGIVDIFEEADPASHDIPFEIFDGQVEPVTAEVPHSLRAYSGPIGRRRKWTLLFTRKVQKFSSGVGGVNRGYSPVVLETLVASRGDGTPGTLAYFDAVLSKMRRAAPPGVALSVLTHPTISMAWGTLYPDVRWARMSRARAARPRRVIVATVEICGQMMTLLEIKRREKETAQATLAFTGIFSSTQLAAVFYACALGRGVLRDSDWQELQLPSFERLTFWHEAAKSPKSSPEHYATRIVSSIAKRLKGSTVSSSNQALFTTTTAINF
jgi:hypothetical protein